jgi:phage tail sheath protein FI
MPVNTTYPGVYIEELPSSVHTISAAPTSVAVFVGYTHPFLTKEFEKPIRVFSFAEYQLHFGGFFSSPWQPDYVGHAVHQFFMNGGSSAFIVGLKASIYYGPGTPTADSEKEVGAASIKVEAGEAGESMTFVALQPVGLPASGANPAIGIAMQVSIGNLRESPKGKPDDTADIVVSYGNTIETYRGVLISNLASALSGSALVAVELSAPAPNAYPKSGSPFLLEYKKPPSSEWTVISPAAFLPVFAPNAPLDKESIFNILVIPGITDNSVMSEAVAYCERKRAFLIMDPPETWEVDELTSSSPLTLNPAPPLSTNAALYYPWLQTTDPITSAPATSPPSGFVAGIFASVDASRGVWKSPAGIETSLLGTTGVVPSGVMTDMQQGVLNNGAVNCLRDFPGAGTVVFGARTVAYTDKAYEQWEYVAVRRMALFLEQSLYANLTWAIYEPNAQPLWQALTQEVSAFMLSLFRQGAFPGTTPSTSFAVQCNSTTTTPTDVANGVVNILVAFAPLVPAEFVVVKIAQLAGQESS